VAVILGIGNDYARGKHFSHTRIIIVAFSCEEETGIFDANINKYRDVSKCGSTWTEIFLAHLDLNVIFYQNMPNLHNLYKSAERKKLILTYTKAAMDN
jgi:hypothetical protein